MDGLKAKYTGGTGLCGPLAGFEIYQGLSLPSPLTSSEVLDTLAGPILTPVVFLEDTAFSAKWLALTGRPRLRSGPLPNPAIQ